MHPTRVVPIDCPRCGALLYATIRRAELDVEGVSVESLEGAVVFLPHAVVGEVTVSADHTCAAAAEIAAEIKDGHE